MSDVDSVAGAVKGAHTVFLVTNYWESISRDVEYQQGRNVAAAAKVAGVSHLIFSTLIHVTEATKGALPNVPHFDGKAEIAKYIRSSGIPATFVLPGYFMSNLIQSLQKQEDGSYQMYLPTSDAARFPLFDVVSDTGTFLAFPFCYTGYHQSNTSSRQIRDRSHQKPVFSPREGRVRSCGLLLTIPYCCGVHRGYRQDSFLDSDSRREVQVVPPAPCRAGNVGEPFTSRKYWVLCWSRPEGQPQSSRTETHYLEGVCYSECG